MNNLVSQREPNPLDHLADTEQREVLRANLAQLTERQREVVTLRFLEGLSTRQTAQITGLASGTIKATLSQALASLRRQWEMP